ncbi:hypothetical protein BCR39DRAFT_508038 [Naematelia encephala]|uniref:Uncharacterized protein n=1 Tax=Naematelia encephala TaxID=71784 RepID=A0A1Y2AK68_9TREE|nr:hypothetical protein BCR39DRAFT_508038 [Naematelia encephala]
MSSNNLSLWRSLPREDSLLEASVMPRLLAFLHLVAVKSSKSYVAVIFQRRRMLRRTTCDSYPTLLRAGSVKTNGFGKKSGPDRYFAIRSVKFEEDTNEAVVFLFTSPWPNDRTDLQKTEASKADHPGCCATSQLSPEDLDWKHGGVTRWGSKAIHRISSEYGWQKSCPIEGIHVEKWRGAQNYDGTPVDKGSFSTFILRLDLIRPELLMTFLRMGANTMRQRAFQRAFPSAASVRFRREDAYVKTVYKGQNRVSLLECTKVLRLSCVSSMRCSSANPPVSPLKLEKNAGNEGFSQGNEHILTD